jgi:hypothetical protein
MSDSKMKHLNNQLTKLKSQIEKFNPSDDISKDQEDMEKLEDLIKDIETEIEEIDNEIEEDEDLQAKKPLLDKVSEQKNEFNIQKNNYNKKKDAARSAHSKELLMQGKLTGVERKKAQRDMALDQVKEVEEQGLMLNSIHDNVKGANVNLTNMNVEVKKQGEQIDRIGDKVITIDKSVKKTGETMGEIERRNCCRKCSLVMGIIVLFLINIIMVFLILAKFFGWGPLFTKKEKIKGIKLSYTEPFDFEKFKNDGYTFVMMESGPFSNQEEKTSFSNKMIDALKQVKLGTYWKIDATDEGTATTQAQEAADFLNDIKNQLEYKVYLQITEEELLKNEAIASNLTQILTNKLIDCGLSMSYKQYKDYYKSKAKNLKIKNYWITDYNKEFNEDNEEKVALWKLDDEVKYDKSYGIIQARKK